MAETLLIPTQSHSFTKIRTGLKFRLFTFPVTILSNPVDKRTCTHILSITLLFIGHVKCSDYRNRRGGPKSAGTGGQRPAGIGGQRPAGIGGPWGPLGSAVHEARWDRRSMRPAGIGSLRPAGIGGLRIAEARWSRCSGVKPSGAGRRRSEARWDRRYLWGLLGPVVWGNVAVNMRQSGAGADLSGTLRGYERPWSILTLDVDCRSKYGSAEGKNHFLSRNAYGYYGCQWLAMGVRFTCYGCPPASMGVLTPTVEYNSPPMTPTIRAGQKWGRRATPLYPTSKLDHKICVTWLNHNIYI